MEDYIISNDHLTHYYRDEETGELLTHKEVISLYFELIGHNTNNAKYFNFNDRFTLTKIKINKA